MEGFDGAVNGAKVVHMVIVNIQNDGQIGVKLQESIYKFTGFASHNIAGTAAAAAMDAGEFSTDESREIDTSGVQNLCQH